MSPWPPEGEPSGKGTTPVTLPRPGHADLAGVLKFGHEDVRNALERASARSTAVHVAAGAVAKALLAELGIGVEGRVVEIGGETLRGRMDRGHRCCARGSRHARRRRRGRCHGRPAGARLVRGEGDRLDARLAAALMGIQAVKGVELGDGFALARDARLARRTTRSSPTAVATNRAGGLEAGVTNGEPVVARLR